MKRMKRIKPKPRPAPVLDAQQERERDVLIAAGGLIQRCRFPALDGEGNPVVGWRASKVLDYLLEAGYLAVDPEFGVIAPTELGWKASLHAATAEVRQGARA